MDHPPHLHKSAFIPLKEWETAVFQEKGANSQALEGALLTRHLSVGMRFQGPKRKQEHWCRNQFYKGISFIRGTCHNESCYGLSPTVSTSQGTQPRY